MNTNTMLLLAVWLVSFAGFLLVTALRANVGRHEDDYLHVLDSDAHLVSNQAVVARKLDTLDRWRTVLLIATVIFGVVLAGLTVYSAWQQGSVSNF